MRPFLSLWLLLLLAGGVSLPAQAQQSWFDTDVARQIGIETCAGCPAANYRSKAYKLGNCRISAFTLAYFDTTATYLQGRVVDLASGKPLAGAVVQVKFSTSCADGCALKTGATDAKGFFRLGWVGCSGPGGGLSKRPLSVRLSGYHPVNTQEVEFGGSAYLHVELAARRK